MTTLYDLKCAVKYQCPVGVTTHSPCANNCGNSARGGLECLDCLEEKIAEKTNALLATDYVDAVKRVSMLEGELEDDE